MSADSPNPPARNGCTCYCHTSPHVVMHVMDCCPENAEFYPDSIHPYPENHGKGLHPTVEGYAQIREAFMKSIAEMPTLRWRDQFAAKLRSWAHKLEQSGK